MYKSLQFYLFSFFFFQIQPKISSDDRSCVCEALKHQTNSSFTINISCITLVFMHSDSKDLGVFADYSLSNCRCDFFFFQMT